MQKEAPIVGSLFFFAYTFLSPEPANILRPDRHNRDHAILDQQLSYFPFDPFHHIHHPF